MTSEPFEGTMRLNTQEGSKIMITDETSTYGRYIDQEQVERYAHTDTIYTVHKMMVENKISFVMVKEIPYIWFNTVNFINLD